MDSPIIPVIIGIIMGLWILVLKARINSLNRVKDLLSGYLTGVLNNDDLIRESLMTISLYYSINIDELTKMLERKKNESK